MSEWEREAQKADASPASRLYICRAVLTQAAVALGRGIVLACAMSSPAEITRHAEQLIAEVEKLIPACMENPDDRDNSQGNVTLFIVAETGQFFGRMFGGDRLRQRGTCRVAWQKATQVWLTAMATGRYEEAVYARKIDPSRYGISHPDFIGWDGGLPVELADGTKFSVAMSGFTGETDCAIIRRAVARIPGLKMAE